MPLFPSFCFSLQQSWTNWPKLLVTFSRFVKLVECGLIQTHWRNITWEMFIAIWNFVKTWRYMLRENNNGRSNREYKRAVIDYFIPPYYLVPHTHACVRARVQAMNPLKDSTLFGPPSWHGAETFYETVSMLFRTGMFSAFNFSYWLL